MRTLDRLRHVIRDVVAGATGGDAYARHIAHLARHHPDAPIPDRKTFAREHEAARWNGIKRCC